MTTSPPHGNTAQSDADSTRKRLRQMASSGMVILGVLVCVFVTAIGVSAMGGYVAGQQQRNISATQTTVMSIEVQYNLGVADLARGNYQLAIDRFRWVLEHSPNYPGAAERLAEAERALASANGTLEPTLIPSTSDNPDQLFGEGQAFFDQQDWPNAISRLEQVQRIDPQYKTIEVKEMLYTAYSALGVAYIRGDRIEEGLYLLEQAEKIHPLDDQIGGERNLARFYRTGQTYWGLDWNVVIRNFVAIYEIAPDYRDVESRLREAYIKWGDQLWLSGAPCDAVIQYDNALNIASTDDLREKRTEAEDACLNPTPLPTATALDGLTPDGTDEPVEETGTPDFIP